MRSASEIFLPPVWEPLKDSWIPSRVRSTCASVSGSLTCQPRCGSRRMRAPFAPPRLSLPRNVEADAHAVETSWATDSPEARIWLLSAAMSVVADELVVHGGDRVLPEQRLLGDQRSEVALDRAHVEVRQLEPDPGERVRQLVRVLQEAPRDRLVDRVEPQREVRRQDRRGVCLRRVVGVRHGAGPAAVSRDPLPQTGGAQLQVPLVAEQGLEEAVVPPRRGGCPRPLEPAGDGVGALPGAVAALPAQALLLEGGALGFGAEVAVRVGRAVGLAERVPARDQRDGLLVVHPHAPERLADVPGRGERVRDGVRALRVDVDEAHLVGGQRGRPAPGRRVWRSSPSQARSGPQ